MLEENCSVAQDLTLQSEKEAMTAIATHSHMPAGRAIDVHRFTIVGIMIETRVQLGGRMIEIRVQLGGRMIETRVQLGGRIVLSSERALVDFMPMALDSDAVRALRG